MYRIECKICGEKFESKFKGRDKGNLVKHINNIHKETTPKEYYTKYYHNGIVPLCACGCGKEVEYHRFSFFKYLGDHKNYIKTPTHIKDKIKNGLKYLNNVEYRMKRASTSKKILEDSFNKYRSEKYSLNKISLEIGLDKRTLKKFWIELGISSKEELDKLSIKTKYLGIRKKVNDSKITDDELNDIMIYIENNRGDKLTINQVKNELNIKFSARYILSKLKDKYGDVVLSYFKLGGFSEIEIEFFHVLRYYFNDSIKLSFKLENKYYDYILGGKLLIELDGTYWHSTQKAKDNDKYKNELAVKHGFEIFRIDEKEAKNIETLKKIKEIYEKI